MRTIYSCFLVIGLLCVMAVPALAGQKVQYKPVKTVPTDMELVDVGVVKDVLRSNMIQLENGSAFILDNIRVPLIWDRTAKDFLTDLIKGKQVGLYSNSTRAEEGRVDPRGNEIVHVVLDDGTWVQAAMVKKGLAWVDSSATNRDCVETLYKFEVPARASHLGFWAAPELAVKDVHSILNHATGSFQIFEGTGSQVRAVGKNWYLNFYVTDQRRSMIVVFNSDTFLMFPSYAVDPTRHGFSPLDFNGVRIRVRGWVDILSNIPMIKIANPEQIEFPDGPPRLK